MSSRISLPHFKLEYVGESVVMFFHKIFSQNFVNEQEKFISSTACTLISLKLALTLHTTAPRIRRSAYPFFSEEIVCNLRDIMISCNNLYRSRCSGEYLTVPEGIRLLASRTRNISEWRSVTYMHSIMQNLFKDLLDMHQEWQRNGRSIEQPELYVTLIQEGRTSLIVIKECRVAIFDSHTHGQRGAFIGEGPLRSIKELCQFYLSSMGLGSYIHKVALYELSALKFTKYVETDQAKVEASTSQTDDTKETTEK